MPVKKKAAEKTPAAKKTKTAKTPVAKKASAKKVVDKKMKHYSLLRGMKDVRPKDSEHWMTIMNTAQNISEAYGYSYIEPPVLEEAQLFIRTIGKGTDVVDKEMYVFEDKDGTKVGLRPEFTAGVVRSFIVHGMHSLSQPVKTWYFGQVFRHDRPQAGRQRQFHQFGAEVIGTRDPVIDAELISVAYNYLRDLGIAAEVHINSIGSLEDRQNYLVELVGYLRSKRSYLSEDSKKRLTKNPLRILDSKDPGDKEVVAEAPQIIDWLSADSKGYFMKVLEYLDELAIPYVLVPTLVRGLDYYTDTVFEIFSEDVSEGGSQSALCGGGRYDGLVEQLGGPAQTPACGFSIGVERVMSKYRQVQEEKPEQTKRSGIYFAQLGVQARRRSLALIEELRRAGIKVHFHLAKGSLKQQLESANKILASHAVIIGQKEVLDGTVIIRDMDSGIQEIVDQKKIEREIRKIVG